MGLWGIGFGELNKQFKLDPKYDDQGNLTGVWQTQQLYYANTFGDGDYKFGFLTELFFKLKGAERDHWRKGVADYAEIQAPIKAAVIDALTHDPPLEIEWSWSGAPPKGMKQGVLIAYDSDEEKYYVDIVGYKPPLTAEQAERLARRAERKALPNVK